jgi:hypothetical protein
MSTFTESEKNILRTAAYGSVLLLSLARPGAVSSTKQNIAGALALTAVPGPVGDAFNERADLDLKGTYPQVARIVLPAITEALAIVASKSPTDVEVFRAALTAAIADAVSSTRVQTNAQKNAVEQLTRAIAGEN